MKGMRHTGIVVKDLKKQLYFYRDLLDLKLVRKAVESGEYIDAVCGLKKVKVTTIKLAAKDTSQVELLKFKTHKGKAIKRRIFDYGLTHISFSVSNVDNIYRRLLKAGARFISRPLMSHNGYAKVAFCRDFEGNLIELVEVL